MFETNSLNPNSNLVSLSQAAALTGYHQDYLGQLCRLGKLPAKKMGRNWFTSKAALARLSSAPQEATQKETALQAVYEEEVSSQDEQEILETPQISSLQFTFREPVVAQSLTVTSENELPSAIRIIQQPIVNTNNVQGILTAQRIENLQKEVSELRAALNRLMNEVSQHAKLLQSHSVLINREDSLRHSYISNFDFSPNISSMKLTQQADELVRKFEDSRTIQLTRPRERSLVTWLVATATILLITGITATIISGSFLGEQNEIQTSYYKTTPIVQEFSPTVAGDKTTIENTGNSK